MPVRKLEFKHATDFVERKPERLDLLDQFDSFQVLASKNPITSPVSLRRRQ